MACYYYGNKYDDVDMAQGLFLWGWGDKLSVVLTGGRWHSSAALELVVRVEAQSHCISESEAGTWVLTQVLAKKHNPAV